MISTAVSLSATVFTQSKLLITAVFWIALLFASALSAETMLENSRAGFSFFGLGTNFIDYEENSTRVISGRTVDVETDSMVNVAQQSGTFVSFNDTWGFYLINSSTIGESAAEESWEIDEVPVRTNKISFEQQRIAFLLSRHYRRNQYLLFGAHYSNTEFRRYGAQLTSAATDFDITQDMINTGTESETAYDFSLMGGFELTTLFINDEPGWRYHIRALLGIPLLTSISNTEVNDGESFSDGFNGVAGQLTLVYGYQFNANVFASFNFDFALQTRNAVDRRVTDEFGVAEFPENTLVYLFPSVALYWSF